MIWLAKIGKLDLLKALFGEIIIPMQVHREVVPEEKTADAILISKAVESGWMRVSEEKLDEAAILAKAARVHLGEAEAIVLARKIGADLIVDEREASETVRMFGVTTLGTIAVLLLALSRRLLKFAEFEGSLRALTSSGFWLSADVYDRVLREARSISKR